jgi:hypothetical protein
MAKKGTPEDRSGPEEVRVTVIAEPGRVRAMLTSLLAGAPVRVGLASVALIAAVVAVAIIIASSSTGRHPRSPLATHPPLPADSGDLAKQFGLRLNCAHLTVVLPDGAYARIDLDRAGPCGRFGNQMTLILHHVHGTWVREFEASRWTCPISQLPQPVATGLRLCGRTIVPPRPAVSSPQGVL